MSKMWSSFLECIRILGNESGCHQKPERSFFYKGKQFPVCARCTGVLAGHTTAVLLFLFKKQLSPTAAVSLMTIMGIDWGLQEAEIKESTNRRRLLTGFCGGLGLYSLYFFLARQFVGFIKLTNIKQKDLF